jgi:hypothetical protein
MPVGTVLDYALPTLPAGGKWEWADGAAITVANTAAAPLRAALVAASNPYGVSGSDPRKPDYRGRTGFGRYDMGTGNPGDATRNIGSTLGGTGGAMTVTLTLTQIPYHSHANYISDPGHYHDASGGDNGHGHGGGIGVNGGHNHFSASFGNFWVNKTPASLFLNHVSGGAYPFGQDSLTETRAGHDHGLSINTGYASIWVSSGQTRHINGVIPYAPGT